MNDDVKSVLKQCRQIAHERQKQQLLQVATKVELEAKNKSFQALIKETLGVITPLKMPNRVARISDMSPIKPRVQVVEEMAQSCYFYVADVGEHDVFDEGEVFAKNGRGADDIRRLASGHWPIVATLDLHDYSQLEAQQALNRFVSYVEQRGVCAEVVHGSGLGSRSFQSVLKPLVRRWLQAHPKVLAYAPRHKNNDGSLVFLLRKTRK